MQQTQQQNIIQILKFILPLGIGVYLTWYFYNSMDTATKAIFFDAIRNANYFWIILSMVLGWLSHIIRAYRWKYMLEPLGYSAKFWHRFHAVMIGYLINLLLPRAGEPTRAAMLYRSDRIPFSKSFGTIIGERVFDMLVVGGIVLITLYMSLEDLLLIWDKIISNATEKESVFSSSNLLYIILVGFFLFAVIFLYLWKKSAKFQTKIKDFISGVIKGVFSILKSKNPFQFMFYTIAIWAIYLLYFGICFQAFEVTKDFPLAGIFVGFIAGTFGIAFTNGGIGAYPYLVGIVVMFYMGDTLDSGEEIEGIGKALGMVIWLSQTVLIIILGMLSLILLPKNYKKEDDDKMG